MIIISNEMEFPFKIMLKYGNRNLYVLNERESLDYFKYTLCKTIEDNKSFDDMFVVYKLHILIDSIGINESYVIINNNRKYFDKFITEIRVVMSNLYDLKGVNGNFNIDHYPFVLKHIELMYKWSKQYEKVIHEDKKQADIDMEQKLLASTLDKLETFADMMESYESKIEAQNNILTSQQEVISKMSTEMNDLQQKFDQLLNVMNNISLRI